jgi:hypothetical protein
LLLCDSSYQSFCYFPAFISLLFLTGCGNVGDPLPPLIQIPEAVSDLQAVQVGKSVRLSWTLPKLNTDGSAATTLSMIEIYRIASSSAGPVVLAPRQFGESAETWRRIPKDDFARFQEGGKLVLTDELAEFPSFPVREQFHYAIRAVNQKNQDAGLSNFASLQILAVPRPPENLRSTVAERSITLNWDTPALNIDGSLVTERPQFNVYRSLDPHFASASRLNGTPVADDSFTDESIELDKTYYYAVRSLGNVHANPVEGDASTVNEVTNRDTYAPRAPTEVTAVSNGTVIGLVWLPNTEPDLAGYWVYRSGNDRKFERLGERLLTTASTIDQSVEKGQTYFYRIQALDLKGNASELSTEVSETVE